MFRTTIHFGFNAFSFHLSAQMTDKLFDIVFAVETAFMQQFCDAFVFGRVQITEAVIFQLRSVAQSQDGLPTARTIGALFCRQYAFIFRRIFYFPQMSNTLRQFDDHAAKSSTIANNIRRTLSTCSEETESVCVAFSWQIAAIYARRE